MRVRERLSYRTFVLDLFSCVHFMSDETADMLNLDLSAPAQAKGVLLCRQFFPLAARISAGWCGSFAGRGGWCAVELRGG